MNKEEMIKEAYTLMVKNNPDIFDYMRLDRNNDKVIDLADSVITINEVNSNE